MNRFSLSFSGIMALLTASCAAQQIPMPFFHAVDTSTAAKTLPNFNPEIGYNLLRTKDSTMLFYQYSWHEYVTKDAGASGHVWLRNVGPGIFDIGPQDTLFFKGSGVTFTKTGTDTLLMTVAAGAGDITDVGPAFSSGAAFTDGAVSTGTTMLIWEGTTPDGNELNLISPTADPASDINITFPSATSTIVGHASSVLDVAGLGLSVSGTTLIWDATELGNITWGTGGAASLVYDFNLSAGDPQLTLGNGVFNISSGTLQQGGTAVVLQSRTVSTTSPLAGGGALSSDLTLSITANGIGPTQIDETANYTWTGKHDYTGAEILGGSAFRFEGATDDNIYTIFAITDPTSSSKTITFPNASGTVAVSATAPITLSAAGAIGLTQNAGTDVTADLEEETHASEHQDGGADEISVTGLSGLLADVQTVGVRKNSTGTVFTRQQLNFIEGTNITLTVADDAGTPETDITITASGGSGDITAVGPMYASGDAFTDGVATSGTTFIVIEGSSVNTAEFNLIAPTADPASDINITFPSATATLATLDLTETFQNKTLTSPIINTPSIVGTASFSNTSAASVFRMYENDLAGTDYVAIQAPNDVTSTYTLTLPVAQGGASTFLQNNGSGTLSWTSAITSLTAGNYIDVSGSTIDFDPTEVGSLTWGSGSDFTWTFNTSGLDPTIKFTHDTNNFYSVIELGNENVLSFPDANGRYDLVAIAPKYLRLNKYHTSARQFRFADMGGGGFAVICPDSLSAGYLRLTAEDLPTSEGGTGLGSYTQGDILYYNSGTSLSALAKNTSSTRYLSNTGTSNNPAWAQVNLSNGVTGTLAAAQFPALTGDVTTSAGSYATTIANDVVTFAKMQNVSANAVPARAAGTSGDLSEVALSASQLLGRGSTGNVAAISLGSGLSMSGTTLSSSGTTINVGELDDDPVVSAIRISFDQTDGFTVSDLGGGEVQIDLTNVDEGHGGTGLSSYTQGDILYSDAANSLTTLAKSTSSTRYLSNTGTSNNPAWAQVSLSNGVTGTLAAAQFPALTGDVTTSAGSLTTTVVDDSHNHTTTTISGLDLANDLNTFSSSNLSGRLTDETGSGAAVFGTSPTITNPTAIVIQGANSKTLTESSATNFVRVDVSAGSFVGGTIFYTVYADDGSNFQARSGSFNFSIVNESADTETAGISTVSSESIAANGGTLTVSFSTSDTPTDGINFQANAVSSLSQTTLQIKYRVMISSGTATVTGL